MLFYCLFQYFEEKEYQTESKWNETFGSVIFGKKYDPGDLECKPGKRRGSHEIGGRAHPPGHTLHSCGPLEAPPTNFFHLYKYTYPKTIEDEDRSGVSLPQASVATKNLSGACSGTLPEGGSLAGGHLHHPGAPHDEEGVVHPRG